MWVKAPLALLAPWPFLLAIQWAIGNLSSDGKTDWWMVFAYPLAFGGVLITHLVLLALGSYSWQRKARTKRTP